MDPSTGEEAAKDALMEVISTYLQEKVVLGGQVLTQHAVQKVYDGDVILTYAFSHVVLNVLLQVGVLLLSVVFCSHVVLKLLLQLGQGRRSGAVHLVAQHQSNLSADVLNHFLAYACQMQRCIRARHSKTTTIK